MNQLLKKWFLIISIKQSQQNYLVTLEKQYTDAPRTFGANEGKKEATLELLIIIGNQIAEEYKDLEISMVLGVPELQKSKA